MIQQIPASIQELLVRILIVVVVFTAIWVLRGFLAWALVRPLRRHADRTATQWDNIFLDTVDQPVRYLIVTLGLFVAMRVLLPINFATFTDHVARTLIILIIFSAVNHA